MSSPINSAPEQTLLTRAKVAEGVAGELREQNLRLARENRKLKSTLNLIQPLDIDPAEATWKSLTLRQLLAIAAIMEGMQIKQMGIQGRVFGTKLSPNAISNMMNNAYKKLGVKDRLQLYALVMQSPKLAKAVAWARERDKI